MDTVFDRQRTTSQRWGLSGLALSMLLSSMGVSIANVALPTLSEAFAAPFQSVQWIVISYLLATTTMVVIAGRLGDMMGHRTVLLAGLALFAASSIACGLAPVLSIIIGARTIQGVGAAALMAATVALVRSTVADNRTGSAMGLLGTMSAVGTALGPSIGGILIAGPGWRSIFLLMASLSIPAFVLAYRHLPLQRVSGTAHKGRTGFDMPGVCLLGIALATYALSMTAGGGGFGWFNMLLLLAASAVAMLFVFVETRSRSPLIRLEAFRNHSLSAGLAMNGLVAAVMMATLVVGPFYLAFGLGLGEALVGLVLSAGPVISALSGVPAGRVVDRFGTPRIAVAGLIAMTTGCIALSTLPPVLGVVGYVVAISILTPGYQLFQAANNTAVMANVGDGERGVVSGMLSLSRNLGLITGASAIGAFFSFATGVGNFSAAGAEMISGGMQMTFAAAGGLMIVAFAIGMAGGALVSNNGRHLVHRQ